MWCAWRSSATCTFNALAAWRYGRLGYYFPSRIRAKQVRPNKPNPARRLKFNNAKNMTTTKEKIIKTIEELHRDTTALRAYLLASDYFTAPASSTPPPGQPPRHGCHEGGLAEHCWNVYQELLGLAIRFNISPEEQESVAVVALLHDLCKVNFYKAATRRERDAAGVWRDVPVVAVDDQLPLGHGEKSLYLASKVLRLTDDEALAIRWHMGRWGAEGAAVRDLNAAMSRCQLLRGLVLADQLATYFIEA